MNPDYFKECDGTKDCYECEHYIECYPEEVKVKKKKKLED